MNELTVKTVFMARSFAVVSLGFERLVGRELPPRADGERPVGRKPGVRDALNLATTAGKGAVAKMWRKPVAGPDQPMPKASKPASFSGSRIRTPASASTTVASSLRPFSL